MEEFFHAKNSSVFCAEGFIFMVNFDEIEFLESEIVDDDDTAPVGTLIHVTDDGKVEKIADVKNEFALEEHAEKQKETQSVHEDETQNADRVKDLTPPEAEQVAADVEDVESEPSDATDDSLAPSEQETAIDEQVEQDVEQASTESADIAENVEIESTTDEENVAEQGEPSTETDEQSIEDSQLDEVTVDNASESSLVVATDDISATPVTKDVEQDVEQDVDQVRDTNEQQVEQTKAQPAQTQTEDAPKPKKSRKSAQKSESVVVTTTNKTSLNLKSGKSLNEELSGTNFEIQQPTKSKVVSTKQKQDKAEDLWAVASFTKPRKETATKAQTDSDATEKKSAQKPAEKATTQKTVEKTAAQKSTEKAKETKPVAKQTTTKKVETAKPSAKSTAQKQSSAKVDPKKTAPKKSTKVEDTIKPTTEETKVAKATEKATEKATKPEEKTAKAAKAPKATKEAPVKEAPVKEEKAPKAVAKAPAKDKDEETVLVEGEGKTHGKYVIKKTDKGNFVFKLYSSNYRVVAIGAQAYTTLGAAKIGVQSVIKNAENAPIENKTLKTVKTEKFPKWEIYLDKKGEYRLRLYATNGSLIATTNDGYVDISGAKNGIAAVARASKGCSIVRNDNLW